MGEARRRESTGSTNTHERVSWRRDERRATRSAAAELANIATDGAKLFANTPTDHTRKATPDELAALAAVRDEVIYGVLNTDLTDDQIVDLALSKSNQLIHPQVLHAFVRKLRVVRATRDQAQVPE